MKKRSWLNRKNKKGRSLHKKPNSRSKKKEKNLKRLPVLRKRKKRRPKRLKESWRKPAPLVRQKSASRNSRPTPPKKQLRLKRQLAWLRRRA